MGAFGSQVMASELVGKGQTSMVFSKYNTLQKECRRIALSWLNKQHVQEYSWPLLEASSVRMLNSVLDNPSSFSEYIRSCVTNLNICIVP